MILVFLFLLLFPLAGKDAVLTVIGTTDLHGHSGLGNDIHPGLIRIASAIRTEEKRAGRENLLLIDCGDLLQGTFEASLDQGESMVDALNSLGFDIWVPGNHDFDFGTEVLLARMKRFRGTVLAANLELDGAPPSLRKWILLERSGKRIAVIGCVPPYLRQWIAPAQLKGMRETDIMTALGSVMPEVERAKPDLVILAIHLGRFSAGRLNKNGKMSSLAGITSRFPRIRIVFGGHTHETVVYEKLSAGTVFVQAGCLGDSAVLTETVFPDNQGKDVKIRTRMLDAASAPEDPAVRDIFRPLKEETIRRNREILAEIPFPLGPQKGKKHSPLAFLLAEAMRTGTGADAAFSATLSRYELHPGKLRERNLFLLAPYENFITVLTLTEEQLRAILREQLTLPEKAPFLHAAGLEYRTDAKGNLEGPIRIGGKIPDGKSVVRAAFGSYAVSGAGGRYPVLRDLAATVPREELKLTVRNAFRTYLQKHYPPGNREKKGGL